jgi:hypothetical protein
VTKIWVSLSVVESVAAAKFSMSLKRPASDFPTTDIKDGNGVGMTDPNSAWGMFEYLVGRRGGRRLGTGWVKWEDSSWAIDEAECVEA